MNPSASQLSRVLPCAASAALPQAFVESDRYALGGLGVHGYILQSRIIGRDKALEAIPKDAGHRQFCEQLPLDALPQGGRLEVAVAWDSETDTARILFEGGGRDYASYGIKPTEFVGTIDLFGVTVERAYVFDYKTGWYSHGPAQDSAQLLFAALAVTRLTGKSECGLQFLYLKDDGTFWKEPWPDPVVVDEIELATFAQRLRSLPARIDAVREQIRRNETPTVTSGPHCRYCPAKPYCPAKTSLARSMAGEIITLRDQVGSLTPETAGRVYYRAQDVLDIAKAIIKAIEEQAQLQPIPLSDGYVLKEVPVKWPTKVDPVVAEEVLREGFGPEIAAAAVTQEKHTTLTAITDALRPISPRGTLATNERRAIEAIRQRGGLREGTSPSVRKVKG